MRAFSLVLLLLLCVSLLSVSSLRLRGDDSESVSFVEVDSEGDSDVDADVESESEVHVEHEAHELPAPASVSTARVIPACQKGKFCYTTTVRINAGAAAILGAIAGDWNLWWAGGTQAHRTVSATGVTTFDLSPISVGPLEPIKVHVTVSPAQELGNGVTRLPVTLSGSFEGNNGFTLIRTTDPNVCFLQSFWNEMVPKGAAILLGDGALKAHWLAEDNALNNLNLFLNKQTPQKISLAAMWKTFVSPVLVHNGTLPGQF